jgi:predicted nucleic acid-binding Zn ribbon protein
MNELCSNKEKRTIREMMIMIIIIIITIIIIIIIIMPRKYII